MPYTGPSIVDYLGSLGQANDYSSRAALAAKNGITGYTGTADQNTMLLSKLRGATATPTTPMSDPTANSNDMLRSVLGQMTPSPLTMGGMTATPNPGVTPSQVSAAVGAGWTPAVPTNVAGNPTGATGAVTPPPVPTVSTPPVPTAYQNALTDLKSYEQLSPAEVSLQQNINELNAAQNQSHTNLENQPIALPFITGQEAAVDKTANYKLQNLTSQLDLAQKQRLGNLDATKAVLQYSQPTNVGIGTNLIDPATGQTIAQGQSYSGKTDYSTVAALMKAYPDAGIIPTDTPDAAAQKVSNAPSFYSKNTSTVMKWDPASGSFITYNSKSLPGTTASNFGTGGGSSAPASGSNFGTGGSLSVGASGANVSALQNWLISQGYSIPAGATGYYGEQTAAAVAKFQADHGVNTASGGQGVFGPQTSAAASSKGFSLQGTMTSGGGQNGGTAGGSTGNPFGLNPSSKIDASTLSYMQTGEMPPGLYPDDQNAVRARALQVNPGFNPTIAKANASAIGEQTKILANVTSSINTADANFKLLVDTVKRAGINDNSSPIINGLQNALQKNYIGSGDLNQFNTGIQTLRTEYAQVLARGGQVTDGVRNEANSLIPDNISLENLQKVYNYIKTEGQNVISERQKTIQQLSSGGIPTASTSSSNFGTSGSSGATGDADYQAYLKAIGQ